MSDILSTSSINQLVNSYYKTEYNNKITPLESKKSKYSQLSSTWGTVKSNLKSLGDALSKLKLTSNSSIFSSKSTSVSDETFVSVTASNGAVPSAYSLRVNQLAKNDLLVSSSLTSDSEITSLEGTHQFKITSGDNHSVVNVDLTASETNESILEKITDAVNGDKAIVTSSGSGTITDSGELSFDINGTTTSISYDYSSGDDYSNIVDDLVDQINNNVDGVLAEKVDGNLQVTVLNEDDYISISDTSGTLASTLGIDVTKEQAASGLSTASDFAPTSSTSKWTLSSDESGFDNRLILENVSGGLLDHIGLTSTVLTNRSAGGDDAAGYMYTANSETDNELNAQFTFNGINVQRNNNVFTDLVDGVTFSLKAEMNGTDPDVSVSVDNDTDKVKKEIESFIKSFNTAYTHVKNNYTSDKTTGRGVLTGDPYANKLLRDFQQLAIGDVSGLDNNDYKSLRDIGVTFDPSTGLSLNDESKLEDALNDSPDQVASIFNSDEGVATVLDTKIENYVDFEGTISNLIKSYDNNVNYYKDKIEAKDERITNSAEILREKYISLQTQYASLLSSMSYFNSF